MQQCSGKNGRLRRFGCLLLIGCALSATAAEDRGSLTVALDNDLFGTSGDDQYTNGLEITHVGAPRPIDQDGWLPRLLPIYRGDEVVRFVWSLGQQMYTPDNIETARLIEDDRPYAGWLYASFGLLGERNNGLRRIDKLDVVIGLVGPDSAAEDVQREIHELTNSRVALGWDNQLDNETTLDLQYQSMWMVPLIGDYVDIVPQINTMLGSSQRRVGLGATLRFGSGIGADFGPPLIQPTGSGSHHFRPTDGFYWYVFAGAHGQYVDYNIFLDGNRDGDSHSVETEAWVGDVQAGVVLGWSRLRISLTSIARSREFENQDEAHQFGSLAVSYRY